MSDEPIGVKKGLWNRVWNDSLCFCALLMLLSIIGLVLGYFVVSNPENTAFTHSLKRLTIIVTILLILGTVCGFFGMILSLIPPVRRGLECLLRRRFFWLACLVTFIALVYAEEDWRGWHALRGYEQQWRAKGEKFEFREIVPPAVPDDQNFALTPIVASSYGMMLDKQGHELEPRNTNVINRLMMVCYGDEHHGPEPDTGNWITANVADLKVWQDYYRALAAKTNQFPVPVQAGSPAADVLYSLGKFDAAIAELRQASQLPDSRFPLDYDKDEPAAIVLPHLAALKQATVTLRLRACAELQNGDSDAALADVKLMLYLAGSIRTEPVLISHLVRIALLDITLQPVYEGLAAHRWSDAQLTAIDAELAKLDFLADCKYAMHGELALGISETEYMRRARNFEALDYGNSQSPPFEIGLELMPSGFFYQSELQMARMQLEYILPTVDLDKRVISPSVVRSTTTNATEELAGHGYYGTLARMVFPSLINSVEKFACGQSHTDLARVAIALERFRMAHGEYPATLDLLSPQFMTEVPHDVINGQPLNYRRAVDSQFVLYSVGWNETDDGGVVVYHKNKQGKDEGVDQREGDWVWKYPAK